MRCINSDGVNLSLPSSQLPEGANLDDVTMETAAITDVTSDATISAFPALETHVPADVSPPSCLQMAPSSTRSDSDLTQSDHSLVVKDGHITSRLVYPQQLSSISSPELNTFTGHCSHQALSALSSSSSLCVSGGDSESGSSRTSTARNTLSSGSSLSTVPDDLTSTGMSPTDVSKTFGTLSDMKNFTGSSKKSKGSALTTAVLQNQNLTSSDNKSAIQLPERYRHVLKKSGSHGSVGKNGCCGGSQDLSSREKDLGTALAWIRHEMVQMKEQDKVLLKRFIELRASILQLRCMYEVLGSTSDLSSMDGSSVSLNEMRKPTRLRSTESDAMLSGRLYMATSSLSLPCSPQLSRLRWKSDDFM